MNTGDSHKQIVPPTQMSVKAGFVVYSPKSKIRNIIILNEGELTAFEEKNGFKSVLFKMKPGDLVGVASLLEKEPFKYPIIATQNSNITIISEDCMESELKILPVWLLAVIKNLSSKTRALKESMRKTRTENTLKSLAMYCSHLQVKKEISFDEIIQEYHFLTKVPKVIIEEDLKSLSRRRFISISNTNKVKSIVIHSSLLLNLFVDFQTSLEKQILWQPFSLTLNQKRVLVKISSMDSQIKKEPPEWIAFFSSESISLDVSEWISIIHFGWFNNVSKNLFSINVDKVKYFLAALRYEANLKGTL